MTESFSAGRILLHKELQIVDSQEPLQVIDFWHLARVVLALKYPTSGINHALCTFLSHSGKERAPLCACRGEVDTAEELLLTARDGFIREGIGFDAAMVIVEDLALLHLSTGRLEEVKRLAGEASAIFTAQDIHREAIAALMLFQEAARQEALTANFLHDLATYLKTTRHDPSCPFRAKDSLDSLL